MRTDAEWQINAPLPTNLIILIGFSFEKSARLSLFIALVSLNKVLCARSTYFFVFSV